MTDPIKPVGPDAIDAAAAVDETDAASSADASFEVAASSVTAAPTDPLAQAIEEVAADIRSGAVPDREAATDAVIIRLVNLRFGHVEASRRQQLVAQVHGLMHQDPRFQSRIEALLALAARDS